MAQQRQRRMGRRLAGRRRCRRDGLPPQGAPGKYQQARPARSCSGGLVTWVGINGVYMNPSDTFGSVFVRTIDQVRAATNKPILLSGTGVLPSTEQYANIVNLFKGLAQYRMLGLVWYDGDPRLEGSPQAESAFRLGEARLTRRRG
jgi:hypothetical protein